MIKNNITILDNLDIIFEKNIGEEFCKKKLYDRLDNLSPNKKCLKFYNDNISLKYRGYKNCPYGYTCFFSEKNIFGSLIIKDFSNIKLIKGHKAFLNTSKILYDNMDIADEYLKLLKSEELFQTRKNVFHDLKNSNSFIRDLLDNQNENRLTGSYDLECINHYFDIFEEYESKTAIISNEYVALTSNIKRIEYYTKKIELYDETMAKLELATKKILSNEPENIKRNEQDLYDFFHLVEYRIRYFKRLTEINKTKKDLEIKDINLHKILTKLTRMFNHYATNMKIEIKFQSSPNLNYDIKAQDDVYLAIFILLENALKYTDFNDKIYITLGKNTLSNELYITIKNRANEIGVVDANELKEKNKRGLNATVGNGLGLYIANEILKKQKIELNLKYIDHYFIAEITKFIIL